MSDVSGRGARQDAVGVAMGIGTSRRAVVLGVLGARGGAGTSTLAALTADRLARLTSTVLVDLDPVGGGVDVTVGIEDADGARWPELAGARGDVPGQDVLALLPRWGSCAVLSADRTGASPELDPDVVADVLHALAGAVGALVLDLPRGGVLPGVRPDRPGAGGSVPADGASAAGTLLPACDLVALVARRDLRSVAGALAVRPRLVAAGAPAGLVVPGRAPGGLAVAELAAAVDLPVLWSGPARGAVARGGERGLLPRRGPAASAAGAVVAQVEAAMTRWSG